mmetsp:Transcript_62233/g.163427  ORF Transcript_62233/g.163427 Transcript_62233/m.163427 type:complete len:422 (+) Transcript_62233:80-1345(+)
MLEVAHGEQQRDQLQQAELAGARHSVRAQGLQLGGEEGVGLLRVRSGKLQQRRAQRVNDLHAAGADVAVAARQRAEEVLEQGGVEALDLAPVLRRERRGGAGHDPLDQLQSRPGAVGAQERLHAQRALVALRRVRQAVLALAVLHDVDLGGVRRGQEAQARLARQVVLVLVVPGLRLPRLLGLGLLLLGVALAALALLALVALLVAAVLLLAAEGVLLSGAAEVHLAHGCGVQADESGVGACGSSDGSACFPAAQGELVDFGGGLAVERDGEVGLQAGLPGALELLQLVGALARELVLRLYPLRGGRPAILGELAHHHVVFVRDVFAVLAREPEGRRLGRLEVELAQDVAEVAVERVEFLLLLLALQLLLGLPLLVLGQRVVGVHLVVLLLAFDLAVSTELLVTDARDGLTAVRHRIACPT